MTAIAGTLQTYQAVGNREQLADVIYNIAPTETPFMQNAGRGTAKGKFEEWQTDSLASASTTNQHIEGDDITSFDAVTPTVRLANYTQISRKTLIVSGTQEKVESAGRRSDLAYQAGLRGKELKRDMERDFLWNKGAAAGTSSTPRVAGSLLAFVKTNVNKASDGLNPVYTSIPTDVRTDSTVNRTYEESLLKDVIQKCWTEGASPSTVMVGPINKQRMSGFAGIATKTIDQTAAKPAVIIGAADVYVSDFGTLRVVPNRFQRERDVHVLDFNYISIAYLRPFQTIALAKTGDAEKRLMLAEYTLKVHNEKALGLVADVTTV
jgi:hypothetical protein